jgi:hypothetical protein
MTFGIRRLAVALGAKSLPNHDCTIERTKRATNFDLAVSPP